jgi:hypothetical protein
MNDMKLTSSMLIDFAFLQSWLEHLEYPCMTNDELDTMRIRLMPLFEDAVTYYMEHDGEAPYLAEDALTNDS